MEFEELSVRASAMTGWLHQKLAEAIGEIATLKADLAVLEHRLANQPKPDSQTASAEPPAAE